MGPFLVRILLAAVLVSFAGKAGAADPALCRNCHTPQGAVAPDLAGMPADQFLAAVRSFRAGERTHPVMMSFSRSLSDADVAALAAYFAALNSGK
jgi:cytochrome c553